MESMGWFYPILSIFLYAEKKKFTIYNFLNIPKICRNLEDKISLQNNNNMLRFYCNK